MSTSARTGWVATLFSADNPTLLVTDFTEDQTTDIEPDIMIEVADIDLLHRPSEEIGYEVVYLLTDDP